MIVYISDPKFSTRELLNMINSFSEVTGYKINSNKPFSTQRINRLRKKLGKLLAIINKTAMNIVEHVSFLPVGTYSGYMPRRGIARSSGSTMSNFSEELPD